MREVAGAYCPACGETAAAIQVWHNDFEFTLSCLHCEHVWEWVAYER